MSLLPPDSLLFHGSTVAVSRKGTAIRLLEAMRLHGQVFFSTPAAAARLEPLEACSVSAD